MRKCTASKAGKRHAVRAAHPRLVTAAPMRPGWQKPPLQGCWPALVPAKVVRACSRKAVLQLHHGDKFAAVTEETASSRSNGLRSRAQENQTQLLHHDA